MVNDLMDDETKIIAGQVVAAIRVSRMKPRSRPAEKQAACTHGPVVTCWGLCQRQHVEDVDEILKAKKRYLVLKTKGKWRTES